MLAFRAGGLNGMPVRSSLKRLSSSQPRSSSQVFGTLRTVSSTAAVSHTTTIPARPSRPSSLSQYFRPILSAASSSIHDATPGSAQETLDLLLRGGYVKQSSSGVYTLLPLGFALLRRIEDVIDTEMQAIGSSRLDMPTILPLQLFKQSKRDTAMGNELYRLTDRKKGEWILAPTHEEEVTKVVGDVVHSFRQLPVKVFQITRKHRDEPRPRMGLLRTREFVMKDAYSFDSTVEQARETYTDHTQAYQNIMNRLFGQGRWQVAQADSGTMGGELSHEYHIEDPAGEDNIVLCNSCSYAANVEINKEPLTQCPQCDAKDSLGNKNSFEVGHTFLLGDRYSKALGYKHAIDPQGQKEYIQMGCYGLGVTRLLAVIAIHARRAFLQQQQQQQQQSSSSDVQQRSKQPQGTTPGFIWPTHLAPFTHLIVLAGSEAGTICEVVINKIHSQPSDADDATTTAWSPRILIDDRPGMSAGQKRKEAAWIGASEVWYVDEKKQEFTRKSA